MSAKPLSAASRTSRETPASLQESRSTILSTRETRAPPPPHLADPRPRRHSSSASLLAKSSPPNPPAPRATPEISRASPRAQSAPRHTAENNAYHPSAPPDAALQSIHPWNSPPQYPLSYPPAPDKSAPNPSHSAPRQTSIHTASPSPHTRPAAQETHTQIPLATAEQSPQYPKCFAGDSAAHPLPAPPWQMNSQIPAAPSPSNETAARTRSSRARKFSQRRSRGENPAIRPLRTNRLARRLHEKYRPAPHPARWSTPSRYTPHTNPAHRPATLSGTAAFRPNYSSSSRGSQSAPRYAAPAIRPAPPAP